jgi:redox-sensing transcriptional repressor
VYPSYELTDVVRREGIEIGILAVPGGAAQEATDALVAGGIRCILNFAPVVVSAGPAPVIIRHVDFLNELRILTSSAYLAGTLQKEHPTQ